MSWFTEHWLVTLEVIAVATYFVLRMRQRRDADPFLVRMLYPIAAALNPLSEERKRLSPGALVLLAVGLLLLVLAFYFVPRFSE